MPAPSRRQLRGVPLEVITGFSAVSPWLSGHRLQGCVVWLDAQPGVAGYTGRMITRTSSRSIAGLALAIGQQIGPWNDSSTARRDRRGTLTGMESLFNYVPHPHAQQRQVDGPPKVAAAVAVVHGPGPVGRFNAKVGLKITLVVGTMWAAYLFTLLALVSAPSAFKSGDKIIIIAWIAQTFLQLVLLPVIIVGQNIQAAAADARSQATYDDASAVLDEAKQIQVHLQLQDEAIQQILAQLSAANPTATS